MTLQKDPEGQEEKFLHRFAEFRKQRILEIGCGEGRLTWKYAFTSRQTLGLDPDLSALRLARSDTPADIRRKVGWVCASANHLPFATESFEIAILAWSL